MSEEKEKKKYCNFEVNIVDAKSHINHILEGFFCQMIHSDEEPFKCFVLLTVNDKVINVVNLMVVADSHLRMGFLKCWALT